MGLFKAYKILEAKEDKIGILFGEREKRILNAIKARNFSILAHGTEPITEEEYKKVEGEIRGFIENALESVGVKPDIPQFKVEIR